jgi:hypothetical protein
MMPKYHVTVSLGVGLLGWGWSRSAAVLPLSLAAGSLIDLDHLVDYAWYAISKEHRLILPLHAYEFVIPLWYLARRLWGSRAATAIAASYAIHLISDELGNSAVPGAYLLTWRIVRQFRIDDLSRDPSAGIEGRLEDFESLRRIAVRLLST